MTKYPFFSILFLFLHHFTRRRVGNGCVCEIEVEMGAEIEVETDDDGEIWGFLPRIAMSGNLTSSYVSIAV